MINKSLASIVSRGQPHYFDKKECAYFKTRNTKNITVTMDGCIAWIQDSVTPLGVKQWTVKLYDVNSFRFSKPISWINRGSDYGVCFTYADALVILNEYISIVKASDSSIDDIASHVEIYFQPTLTTPLTRAFLSNDYMN